MSAPSAPMPAADSFSTYQPGLSSPHEHAAAVTPHDTNELTHVTRALYVGGAGALKVTMADGTTVTFAAVPAGTTIPIRVKKVFDDVTDATSIVALW